MWKKLSMAELCKNGWVVQIWLSRAKNGWVVQKWLSYANGWVVQTKKAFFLLVFKVFVWFEPDIKVDVLAVNALSVKKLEKYF